LLPLINLFTGGDEIFLEKDHVDVYDLILDQGCLGALKYADQIERTNIRLASKIDSAVSEIYKNTRFAGDPNNPYNISPNYNPNQELNAPNLPAQNASGQVGNSSVPMPSLSNLGMDISGINVDTAARIQAFRRAMIIRYNGQLRLFKTYLEQGKTIDATKILNNAPKDLSFYFGGNSVAIRSNFIKAAQDTLGVGSPKYIEFIQTAAGKHAADTAGGIVGGIVGKFLPQKAGTFIHPSIQNLQSVLPGVTQAELKNMDIADARKLMARKDLEFAMAHGAVTPAEFTQFANETPNAIEAFLKKTGEQTTHIEALQKYIKTDGLKASEQLLTNAAPSNVWKLENILTKLIGEGSKFSFLGKILKFGGKILGPLAVVLDTKGFFDEYELHGLDGRTICDLCSLMLGAASLIPLLTQFAGPLWLVVSLGCTFFVQHEKEKPAEKTQSNSGSSSSTDSNKLSPQDQQLYDNLIKENLGNTDQLNLVMEQALDNGQFQNPDLVRKMWQK
jgi:hypothetical protein